MAPQLRPFGDDSREKIKQSLLSDGGETYGGWIATRWGFLKGFFVAVWNFGRSDTRKMVFAAKMALALVLVSLLIFLNFPLNELSQYSVWALLTVVVVFEFSIGATLSKGFNRALGTLSAGGLALGVAILSTLTGDWEELVIIISIFIVGFLTIFIKLHPTMKPYEYGFRVFLLTFCFIMVSGYKTREFIETAVSRFLLIALGAGVGLGVNICIYPIWAGEDLHNLVVKNFTEIANSLEGCVNGYLQNVEYKRVPSKILIYQTSDDPLYSGYRAAVGSTSQEEALLGFAIWEPPHGPYKMWKYPWKYYVRVSGAVRHCGFMVMALHGCMLSEIQAPPSLRNVFSDEFRRVGTEGAKVLRELGHKVKLMTKLEPNDILAGVHEAAEVLQKKINQQSYLLVNSKSWEIGNRPKNTDDDSGRSLEVVEKDRLLATKSHSETLIDLRSFQNSEVRNDRSTVRINVGSPDGLTGKQNLWPLRQTVNVEEEESEVFESAKALSLATFASLLMEFVARLQNLVEVFEELSEGAKFKEIMVEPH